MRQAKQLFFIILLFIVKETAGQKQGLELIDSLKLDLVNAYDDTNKISKLCRLAFEYHRFDTKQGIEYAELALHKADSLSWVKGMAYAYNALGVNNIIKGSFPEALFYFQKSLTKYTELGDNRMIATLCNNLGLFYSGQAEYSKAFDYFNKSLAINEKLGNKKGLSLNYGNIAIIFSNQKQFEKANEYYVKALKIDEERNDKDAISRNLSNIASIKYSTKEYCESLSFGFRALKLSKEIKSNYNQGLCNKSVGETFFGVAIDSSIALYSCSFFKPNRNENLRAAIFYLRESISYFSKVNDLRSVSDADLIISKAYEFLNDSKNALYYYKEYTSNRDSVIARENKDKLASIETKFENDMQAKQIEIQSLEVKNKNSQILFQIIVSLILVITISIISIILYKKQKFQKAINLELSSKNLALEKSEERLRVLFETMPIGFYISTLDGRYLDVNPALIKMLGYRSREELLSVSIPNDVYLRAYERDEIIRKNSGFENSTDQYQLKTKDGRVKWVEDNAMYIKDPNGNVIYNEGFCRDITERKIAEEILKENEEKYRNMFDNNPQPMFIYDPETLAFLEVNQSMEFNYGYTREEFFTMNLRELHLPEDFALLMSDIEKAKRSSNPKGEWRHVKKNGEIIFAEIRSHSLKHNGINARHVLVHDVTERKRAEDALRQSEEKFRLLITNIKDVVYSVDIVTKEFKYISPSFEKITGYSDNDIKAMGGREAFLSTVVTKDKFAEWDSNLNKLTENENGINFEHETWWLCKDGTFKCLEDHWTPVFENGVLVSTDGVLIDITERKLAEAAQFESEKKFKDLFETMTNGFYRSTPGGYFVDANPAFVKMLGYDSKEELLRVYIPTDIYVKTEERDEIVVNDVDNNLEVYRLKAKNGQIIWIEDNARYIRDEHGNTIYHEGICQNITDRKIAEAKLRESEDKLNTLFNTMTEMVALHELVFDKKGEPINYRITDCNSTFTLITNLKKEDVIGKLTTEVYQTTHAPYLDEFAKVALSGEPFSYSTYYKPMDTHFMVSVVSPKKNHFATIATDITEIKQIQDAMTSKKNELENYLYVASHDLRSPMVNIQGFSQRLQKQSNLIKELLVEGKIDDELKVKLETIVNDGIPKTLGFILSNVAKMDTLINGLLQISRTGRIKMTIQKIDANRLFKTIIANYNHQITDIGAKVEASNLPECYGDENQLNQLFSNIIGNAIKYRDKNRALVIEIKGRTQYNKVVYSIADTGIGIPQKYLDKIWDVFFRVDGNSIETGEGIGLSLAKRIVDKHKGKIWAESTEKEGSTFYIELQKDQFSE